MIYLSGRGPRITAHGQTKGEGFGRGFPLRHLKKVLALLPALQKPTVSALSDPAWCDINTIIEEMAARDLIPALKEAGAAGIVEYPLSKIIP